METVIHTRRTRTNQNLTDTQVKTIKPRATLLRVWDSHGSGFHLQVTPGGTKPFRIQFQRPDGREQDSLLALDPNRGPRNAPNPDRIADLDDHGRG